MDIKIPEDYLPLYNILLNAGIRPELALQMLPIDIPSLRFTFKSTNYQYDMKLQKPDPKIFLKRLAWRAP